MRGRRNLGSKSRAHSRGPLGQAPADRPGRRGVDRPGDASWSRVDLSRVWAPEARAGPRRPAISALLLPRDGETVRDG
jgi:hypothetical protein